LRKQAGAGSSRHPRQRRRDATRRERKPGIKNTESKSRQTRNAEEDSVSSSLPCRVGVERDRLFPSTLTPRGRRKERDQRERDGGMRPRHSTRAHAWEKLFPEQAGRPRAPLPHHATHHNAFPTTLIIAPL